MFENLKEPKDITKYQLMRGVTDFGNLAQWNLYETGYSFLKIVKVPIFLENLAASNSKYNALLETYKKILEFEFKQLDGIDDLTTETLEINNNISTLAMISKVNEQSNAQISMPYFERSGSPLTRLHELFLRGIRDPKTTYKHYNGLIESEAMQDWGYEYETFTFLYGVTDNTGMNLEKAYLLLAAQPTKAETSMYNYTKGTIENKELTLEFNCFPVVGDEIDRKARIILDDYNTKITKNSYDFKYTGVDKIPETM